MTWRDNMEYLSYVDRRQETFTMTLATKAKWDGERYDIELRIGVKKIIKENDSKGENGLNEERSEGEWRVVTWWWLKKRAWSRRGDKYLRNLSSLSRRNELSLVWENDKGISVNLHPTSFFLYLSTILFFFSSLFSIIYVHHKFIFLLQSCTYTWEFAG